MALTLHGTVSDNTVALDRKSATPIIINGDMAIAQRGDLTGRSSGDNYVTDNFFTAMSSLGTFSISQDTDVPTGQGFRKSLKLDCTTAASVDGASDYIAFQKRIESQDLQLLKKGTSSAEYVTIAFWVKSTVTGTGTLEIQDENSRTISQTYTISSSNTWEKKVLSFVGDTSGALGNDNAKGFELIWWLGAGTTFTSGTLNTSWNAQNNANRVSSSNINIASSTDNNFYVTGVQLEVGQFDSDSIPSFQFEDFGTTLSRCQRYYQHSFPYGTAPQNYSSYVAGQSDNSIGGTMSSTEFKTVITFKCEMRSAPTITYYRAQNTPEDSEWTFYDGADKLNPSSMASNAQTHRFTATLTYSSGLTAGNAGLCQGNYSSDAEL